MKNPTLIPPNPHVVFLKNILIRSAYIIASALLFSSCDPFVDTIDEPRETELFYNESNSVPAVKDTLLIMSWNIRFGCGSQILWFGDACGNRTVLKRTEILVGLDRIIEEINRIKPDIVMLQEVDRPSKRSAYIDEMRYIMDKSYFRYGSYATNWKVQFIPSDGIGRIDEGNAVLSRWPIVETQLLPLPLRGDIDALTRYFYVRENVMTCRISAPGMDLNIANTHLSAFSTDDTKRRQFEKYLSVLDEWNAAGKPFVTGGDYNLLPPNSDTLDYCDKDKCPNEHFHSAGDSPLHKDGSNYAPEIEWLAPVFAAYYPSLPLNIYKADQRKYYTHTTDPKYYWDRTLDHLFSNRPWVANSHTAHQNLRIHSDHAPVTALVRLK